MKKAICVLKCELGHQHGIVTLTEISPGGPLKIRVSVKGVSKGFHGFHVHRKGNESEGSRCLCDHYNPTGQSHGALNSPRSHAGDLGNLYSDGDLLINTEFTAKFISLTGPNSVLGRSLVIHADKDDLGRGHYPDSSTTGHSGKRILWGIIGVNDD